MALQQGFTSDERFPVLDTENSSMTSSCGRSTFASMDRIDGRGSEQLRPVAFDLGIAPYAGGSMLVTMGNTRVICGVTIEEMVPRWMKEEGVTGGWLTAEFHTRGRRKSRGAVSSRLEKRFVDIRSGDILTSAVTAIGKPAAKLSASLARRRMIVCRDGQCYLRSWDEREIINV